MALFGSGRDASLFRRISRELMGNIISQQCVFYKFSLDKTTTNMYGEASGGRFYKEPIILNVAITNINANIKKTQSCSISKVLKSTSLA